MKKLILSIALCCAATNFFAQNADPAQLVNDGKAALEAKNYQEAYTKFSTYLTQTNNQDSVIAYNCGVCADKIKKPAEALKYFDIAVQKKYNLANAYIGKAGALKDLKKNDEYVATLKEGLEANPGNKTLWGFESLIAQSVVSAFEWSDGEMGNMDFEKKLKVTETNIPGLLVFDLPVHGDNRGWFKENWQRAKMLELGLPDFGPVQNNISFNAKKGVTRGIHAEPWDKYISIATGEIFGAWVDLRPGESFGQVYTTRLDPSKAIYVPRGVGNSFQALEDGTAYTYLVNAHWSLEQKKTYTFVNLADPELNIPWPIPLEESERSEADLHHPMLKDAKPMAPRRTMVTGCNGQLGHAIRDYVETHGLQGFEFNDIDTFDFSDPTQYDQFDWSLYGTIINAGAYTAVDKAETDEGRPIAWKANAQGPALLAGIAKEHNITLVHVSSDYVFDGVEKEHSETEAFAPLGVYGQTKAAGDIAVANAPRHYIVRSSWVIGEGHNFVKTMMMLSNRVADPNDQLNEVTVVDDQYGRLTFTTDMAKAIFHLLDTNAEYGTYNLTGSGAVKSWADIAKAVFDEANGNGDKQQFDGNILGPLILGDKLGLPSIGILFSVCVGGGLFGIIGMFIGVPCFAVIYAAVREFVNYRLKQKKLSLEQLSFQAQKEAKQKEEEFEEIIRDDE